MRAFILVILSLLLGISGNRQLANQFSMANMSQTLQVALAQGIMIENIDTHGGFHGDGQSLTIWKFDDNSILEQILTDPDWKELPMTDNLEALLYGVVYDTGLSITEIGPCVDFLRSSCRRFRTVIIILWIARLNQKCSTAMHRSWSGHPLIFQLRFMMWIRIPYIISKWIRNIKQQQK